MLSKSFHNTGCVGGTRDAFATWSSACWVWLRHAWWQPPNQGQPTSLVSPHLENVVCSWLPKISLSLMPMCAEAYTCMVFLTRWLVCLAGRCAGWRWKWNRMTCSWFINARCFPTCIEAAFIWDSRSDCLNILLRIASAAMHHFRRHCQTKGMFKHFCCWTCGKSCLLWAVAGRDSSLIEDLMTF